MTVRACEMSGRYRRTSGRYVCMSDRWAIAPVIGCLCSTCSLQRRLDRRRDYVREWQRRQPLAKRLWKSLVHSGRHWQYNPKGAASVEDIEARLAFYGFHCAYCGIGKAECLDHVIPLSRGGSNWPANLRPACKSCNSEKRNRTLSEWRQFRAKKEVARLLSQAVSAEDFAGNYRLIVYGSES